MAKSSKSWTCTGIPENSHDAFDNFGPDCSICGARKEDVIKKPERKLPTLPVKAIAAVVAGAIVVLGGGAVASPNIPGLCEMVGNCSIWSKELSEAKRMADSGKQTADQAKSIAELQDAQSQLNKAISSLTKLNQRNSLKTEVQKVLPSAKEALDKLEARLPKEQEAQKTLDDALKLAQTAEPKSTKDSKVEDLSAAEKQWKDAIALLGKVSEGTIAKPQASAKASEFEKKLQSTSDLIAAKTVSPEPIASNVESPSGSLVERVYKSPDRVYEAPRTWEPAPAPRSAPAASDSNLREQPLW